jgi:hypothetical protein
MKKLLILFITTLSMARFSFAQNIGIGTATPSAKLQVNHRTTASSPTLRLFDSTAGTGSSILFAKEAQSNSFSVVSIIGLLAANNTLDFRTTFNSGILLRGDGRVGINNITSPTATLHVGGGVKINDTLLVEGGVKINDTLNVSSDVNISGKLKLNNDAGIAGQVLISNGIGGNPEWANSSYPSNERAWIKTSPINMTSSPFEDTINLTATDYNTSSATFNFTNNTITINKTGLYRFQGMIFVDILDPVKNGSNTSTYSRFILNLSDDNLIFPVCDEPLYNAGFPDSRGISFSVDRHISAGSVICPTFRFVNLFSASNVSICFSGSYLSFYLIAE